MIRSILILIFILTLFLNVKGQSNDYFIHSEGWASIYYGPESYGGASYTFQVGDTIIDNDTLIKLKQPHAQFGSSPDTNYFLAKSNLGILNLYLTNSYFNVIGDSTIIDFSRTDSITQYTYYPTQTIYYGSPINSIDTVYFGAVGKKIFRINDLCGQSDDDFVYEGVVGFYDACFEYANILTCYSIFDTTYYVNWDTFSNSSTGNCTINNLGLQDLNSENKKLVRTVDLMGRDAIEKPNNIFIYIYSDGTTEKVFRIE
jgi:hypothetical protein